MQILPLSIYKNFRTSPVYSRVGPDPLLEPNSRPSRWKMAFCDGDHDNDDGAAAADDDDKQTNPAIGEDIVLKNTNQYYSLRSGSDDHFDGDEK